MYFLRYFSNNFFTGLGTLVKTLEKKDDLKVKKTCYKVSKAVGRVLNL